MDDVYPSHETKDADASSEGTENTSPVGSQDYMQELLNKNGFGTIGNNSTEQYCWTLSVLKKCLTHEIVRECLNYHGCQSAEALAAKICGSPDRGSGARTCIRVFAALVLSNNIKKTPKTIDDVLGICDDDLPLQFETYSDDDKHKWARLSSRRETKPAVCFTARQEAWGWAEKVNFANRQWQVSPHIFNRKKDKAATHEKLDSQAILPYITESLSVKNSESDLRSGSFSTVRKVEIHVECHNFGPLLDELRLPSKYFAVKKLRMSNTKEFEAARDESDQLRRFDGKVHPHLVTLLATYEMAGQYYFVFPYADFNLEMFWAKKVPLATTKESVQWLSSQMCGLLEGLLRIHEPPHIEEKYGRHGDIKPDNILCYRSGSGGQWHLVISDLGISKLNSENSRSNVPGESVSDVPGYRPPECDVDGGYINRLFDIWTMGCLFLEMVTYLLGGEDLRVKFDNARTSIFNMTGCKTNIFYDIDLLSNGKIRQSVKPSVQDWFSELKSHPDSTKYLQDVVSVIENHMIVVLHWDKKNPARWNSSQLSEKFMSMHKKCMEDDDYCARPKPQDPRFVPRTIRPLAIVATPNKRTATYMGTPGKSSMSSTGQEKEALNPQQMADIQRVEPSAAGLEIPGVTGANRA